jgi:DNA-binding MltR family transcriptional regulator
MTRPPFRTPLRRPIRSPTHDLLEELERELHEASKRGQTAYVLVVTTALEGLLEQAIISKMRKLSKTFHATLFNGYGPLATFSAKIDIAYAFNIIDEDIVGDFRGIKDIRNAFAHPNEVVHFNNPKLIPHLQKLSGYRKDCDVRGLFDERLAACVEVLTRHVDVMRLISALKGEDDKSKEDDDSKPPWE